jgi:CRP-like cAMP-binding protein
MDKKGERFMTSNTALAGQLSDTCKEFVSALTRQEISTFVDFTEVVEVGSKEVFADIGEIGDRFYLVIGGEVRLFREEAGRDIDVGTIGPGGLVGEMSFFDRQPRTIRLAARRNGVRLLSISRKMYRRMTFEHPFIAVNLLEFVILSLDKLIRSTSQDISSLHSQVTGMGMR